MDDYIRLEDAINAIREHGIYGSGYSDSEREENVIDMLTSIPAADVRPVVRGKWEVDGHHIRCSICGEYMCIEDREGVEIPREYCPNCGAKMEEI